VWTAVALSFAAALAGCSGDAGSADAASAETLCPADDAIDGDPIDLDFADAPKCMLVPDGCGLSCSDLGDSPLPAPIASAPAPTMVATGPTGDPTLSGDTSGILPADLPAFATDLKPLATPGNTFGMPVAPAKPGTIALGTVAVSQVRGAVALINVSMENVPFAVKLTSDRGRVVNQVYAVPPGKTRYVVLNQPVTLEVNLDLSYMGAFQVSKWTSVPVTYTLVGGIGAQAMDTIPIAAALYGPKK
jgi:hypothetical protein